MDLDHSRSGRIVCVRQVYFTKSCQQISWCILQTNLLYFLYITSEVKQYYLLYRPRQFFTIFEDKLHSVNITKTSVKVSLNILSRLEALSLSLCLKPASRYLLFSKVIIAQSVLFTAKFTTKYSSERFLSICGAKIYLPT